MNKIRLASFIVRVQRSAAALLASSALLLPLVTGAATGDPDGFHPIVNHDVNTATVQPDGSILIGGDFSYADGLRDGLVRFNAAGSLESAFNPDPSEAVHCTAIQADGKILLGGFFNIVGGVPRTRFARINANGTLDTAFNAQLDGAVYCIALQADGRILVGGTSATVGGVPRRGIARLNSDGTLDTNFNAKASYPIYCLAVQPDGKILVGGHFTTLGGAARMNIGRVNADGTLDTNFNASAVIAINTLGVNCLVVQPDGKILVGGSFTNLNGVTRNLIGRLNADGTLDASFNPNPRGVANFTVTVNSIVLQADGKMLVGGNFTNVAGVTRTAVARLDANGLLDTNFNPVISGTDPKVLSLALQADGKILMGGVFTTVNGQTRSWFARLENDAATQSLTVPTAHRVRWLRGGAAQEVQGVTFELSTDGGATFALLGSGTRISGGWELTGLNLPAAGAIRGRARTMGGKYNASESFVETVSVFSPVAASNLSAAETYVEDTPLNLTDVVITSASNLTVTATLSLSTPAAGSLSTATSGSVTSSYDVVTGIWTASGPMVSVNALLAGVTFKPATNFNSSFNIATSVTEGTVPITGSKTMTGTAVNDPPTLVAIANSPAIDEDAGLQTVNLTGISAGGGEVQTLTVTATSGNTNLIPHPTVTYTSPNANGSLSYTPVANASGSALVTVTVNDGQALSNITTRTFTVTVNPVNDPPTLTAIGNLPPIIEDPGLPYGLNLTGISAGGGEAQTLTITATSGNTNLIPHPTVTYTSPNANGSLSYTPVANANGTALITVTVNDGGMSDNNTTQTFIVSVNAVNDPPTLADMNNPAAINEDAELQAVNLTGISEGGGEVQTLTITATSENTNLIPHPTVTYTSPNANGSLSYTPVANANGAAVITVTVSDDGTSNNITTRTFTVTITPVNDPPGFTKGGDQSHPFGTTAAQTFAGWATDIDDGDASVTQSLTFNITNSNPGLFTAPPSVAADGTFTYTPNGSSGTATIGVSLTDDATAGGPALTTAVQTFTITVARGPEISVEQPTGTAIVDGGTKSFGAVAVGSQADLTFTVTNSGVANLTGLSVTVDGADAGMLTLSFPSSYGSFALASSPAVDVGPASVVAADVNADGHMDLIDVSAGFDVFTVMTNNGTGGFALSSLPATGRGPTSLAVADVNGDGEVDLISADQIAGTLSVQTNNGSGGFALASSPAVGVNPSSVAAADVNGDGKMDLVTANLGLFNGTTLTVLTNNGSAGFALSSSPSVGLAPGFVTAADVNGDGKADLINVNYGDGTLTVLTNNGTGGFAFSASPGTGGSVAVVDIDGDGKMDLVVPSYSAGNVSVLTNDGGGGFVLFSASDLGAHPSSATTADVNGDGKPDLITANAEDDTLSVLINDGNGGFTLSAPLLVGDYPNSVAAADVNGDGRPDLITANNQGDTLSVLFNTPTTATNLPASIAPAGSTSFTVRFSPASIGLKTATLHITSNDADANPYDLTLTGTGTGGGLTPPVIDPQSLRILGNGSFQFSFTNTNNVSFSVLAATDISLPASNWTVLGVATNIGGDLYGFTDPQATNFPRRFYLLRIP